MGPPTKNPTVAATPLCTQCSDNETPGMIANGRDCTTDNTLTKKCNKKQKWITHRYCQLSCYNHGLGYTGDNCCPVSVMPTESPTVNPTRSPTKNPTVAATPLCTQCSDNETPGMIANGRDCTTDDTLTKRCNQKQKWITHRYCQLSCYNHGLGYAGDNCCSS